MKATGIVRRIDDLGRVVIPKEIRRILRVREGDPLEIYTENDKVIFRKYSPMHELSEFAQSYVDSIHASIGRICIVCDNDNVIAHSRFSGKSLLHASTSEELQSIILDGNFLILKGESCLKIVSDDASKYSYQMISPIKSEGDIVGALIICCKDKGALPTDTEAQLIKIGASFLGKQMEV